ncbi:MAG TPA: RimK family alpha-L-glutamate ligase [Gemmatimonadales bacterium]|nr:RimK family alpha-L-glutamate ligase [Gemmatimonadales bacterium]
MRVAILSARQGWHTDQLCRALTERGHEGRVLPYDTLAGRFGDRATSFTGGGEDLASCAAVLARIIPAGSLEQIVFRVDVLHALEERGMLVINSPRTIERTVDKLWTTALLAGAGLTVPATIVCERPEDALDAFRSLGGDVIVKPLFGSMGLGMVRVSDEDMAFRVFRTVETLRGVYYLQRAIDHAGCDLRVFVVGGRVVGAIERSAPGWKTNLARGGRARSTTLNPQRTELALAAAHAVAAEYAGVDLLPARDGTVYVVEVNGIPGWRGLQEATSNDIAGTIVEHVLRRAEAR